MQDRRPRRHPSTQGSSRRRRRPRSRCSRRRRHPPRKRRRRAGPRVAPNRLVQLCWRPIATRRPRRFPRPRPCRSLPRRRLQSQRRRWPSRGSRRPHGSRSPRSQSARHWREFRPKHHPRRHSSRTAITRRRRPVRRRPTSMLSPITFSNACAMSCATAVSGLASSSTTSADETCQHTRPTGRQLRVRRLGGVHRRGPRQDARYVRRRPRPRSAGRRSSSTARAASTMSSTAFPGR